MGVDWQTKHKEGKRGAVVPVWGKAETSLWRGNESCPGREITHSPTRTNQKKALVGNTTRYYSLPAPTRSLEQNNKNACLYRASDAPAPGTIGPNQVKSRRPVFGEIFLSLSLSTGHGMQRPTKHARLGTRHC